MIHYSFFDAYQVHKCDLCGAAATIRFTENESRPGYLCSHHAARDLDGMYRPAVEEAA
jgi:hypothetical protein